MIKGAASALIWTIVLSLAAALLLAAGLFFWDQPVLEAVRHGFGKGWKDTAKFFSRYGDFPWLFGAALLVLGFTLRTRRRQWTRVLVVMLLAGVVAGLTSNLIKLGAGRVRPRVDEVSHGWYGTVHHGEWVSIRHIHQSFPSSHAACAFGFFFPLFLARQGWGSLGLAGAVAIAWSRVQLNAHHVSDVAAGALLGMIVGWIIWRWIVQRGGLSRWLGRADC